MQEEIKVEYGGTIYTGHFSVEGINKKRVIVYYRGKKKTDNFDYHAEQPGYIEALAERLLLEMIIEKDTEVAREAEMGDE